MARGRFIALEGLDGAGTSTQAGLLASALRDRGLTVVQTNQPSEGAIGRQIRERLKTSAQSTDPKTVALLFAADRLDHVQRVIEPALAAGSVLVCDRYVVSSWVYQSLQCPPDWVRTINRFAPWPDLTVFLRVPTHVAVGRISGRDDEREIYETDSIQARVARGYAQVEAEGHPGWVSVDGTASVADVTAQVLATVASILPAANAT